MYTAFLDEPPGGGPRGGGGARERTLDDPPHPATKAGGCVRKRVIIRVMAKMSPLPSAAEWREWVCCVNM